MPASLRAHLRALQHPALTVHCGHCGAAPGRPCRLRSTRAVLASPHDSRQTDARLVATAVCPACQVEPGIPCRTEAGRPYPGVHPQRHTR
ncbi:zinc finger domain-containing protein [Kitasatospora sp. NPDC054939]